MVAGLAFQVTPVALFILLASEFAWRARSRKSDWSPDYVNVRQSLRFRLFLIGQQLPIISDSADHCQILRLQQSVF